MSLLATSRRPLGVAGEAVVVIRPLAVPENDGDPGGIEESPAGRLFVERARAARPGWQLGGPEAEAVARICRRLDGLPLALELAASRLRALSAPAIAERLDEGLAVLGRGTLDASIEASHALLAPGERELFRRLSVFEAGFGLEDAEQVGGGDGLPREHVLELLVELSEHSMVQAEGDAPRRYRLLEALRADARARLDEEAAEAAARRHAAHLARVAATAAARVGPEGAEAAGDPLIPWRADMEAAYRWALDRRDADVALELAAGFAALHHRFGTVALAVEYLDQALALDGGAPPKRLGALWWHVPMLLAELRVGDARLSLEQARALAADHADAAKVAGLRVLEGQVELCAGNLESAQALLAGLPGELIGMDERFIAGAAAWTLGSAALARGAPTEAVALFTAACDHYAACHDVCSLDGAAADLAEAATLQAARPRRWPLASVPSARRRSGRWASAPPICCIGRPCVPRVAATRTAPRGWPLPPRRRRGATRWLSGPGTPRPPPATSPSWPASWWRRARATGRRWRSPATSGSGRGLRCRPPCTCSPPSSGSRRWQRRRASTRTP